MYDIEALIHVLAVFLNEKTLVEQEQAKLEKAMKDSHAQLEKAMKDSHAQLEKEVITSTGTYLFFTDSVSVNKEYKLDDDLEHKYIGSYAKGHYCAADKSFQGVEYFNTITKDGKLKQITHKEVIGFVTSEIRDFKGNLITSATLSALIGLVHTFNIRKYISDTTYLAGPYTGMMKLDSVNEGCPDNPNNTGLLALLPEEREQSSVEEKATGEKGKVKNNDDEAIRSKLMIMYTEHITRHIKPNLLKKDSKGKPIADFNIIAEKLNDDVKNFLLSNKVAQFYDKYLLKDIHTHDNIKKVIKFLKNRKPTTPPKKGGSDKIFYKGRYYKIRTDCKKKYILTKHKGRVSLSNVRAWLSEA